MIYFFFYIRLRAGSEAVRSIEFENVVRYKAAGLVRLDSVVRSQCGPMRPLAATAHQLLEERLEGGVT